MKALLAALLVAHGLIHLLGATRPWGWVWVVAAVLFATGAILLINGLMFVVMLLVPEEQLQRLMFLHVKLIVLQRQ